VLASAAKAAAQQPLIAAAHNTLGLAYEARQQPQLAAGCYRLALALLQAEAGGAQGCAAAGRPGWGCSCK
jgi:hypothetical protein